MNSTLKKLEVLPLSGVIELINPDQNSFIDAQDFAAFKTQFPTTSKDEFILAVQSLRGKFDLPPFHAALVSDYTFTTPNLSKLQFGPFGCGAFLNAEAKEPNDTKTQSAIIVDNAVYRQHRIPVPQEHLGAVQNIPFLMTELGGVLTWTESKTDTKKLSVPVFFPFPTQNCNVFKIDNDPVYVYIDTTSENAESAAIDQIVAVIK